uniref:Uncharacterized protein n=1 Tax=Micrurus spixii TaxID=129469 RepID=A0A2D4LZ31_9SAUR
MEISVDEGCVNFRVSVQVWQFWDLWISTPRISQPDMLGGEFWELGSPGLGVAKVGYPCRYILLEDVFHPTSEQNAETWSHDCMPFCHIMYNCTYKGCVRFYILGSFCTFPVSPSDFYLLV